MITSASKPAGRQGPIGTVQERAHVCEYSRSRLSVGDLSTRLDSRPKMPQARAAIDDVNPAPVAR